MFQSRLSFVIIFLIVVCAAVVGGVAYLGRAQDPAPVMVHHVVAAPEAEKTSPGNVTLPDVAPRKP